MRFVSLWRLAPSEPGACADDVAPDRGAISEPRRQSSEVKLHVRGISKSYGTSMVLKPLELKVYRRRVAGAARAVRFGKDDAAADHLRSGRTIRRTADDRRPRRDRQSRQQARHRRGVPELCAVSASHRSGECRVSACRCDEHRRANCATRSRRRSRWSACPTSATAFPGSCPADSSSAWRLHAASSTSRR